MYAPAATHNTTAPHTHATCGRARGPAVAELGPRVAELGLRFVEIELCSVALEPCMRATPASEGWVVEREMVIKSHSPCKECSGSSSTTGNLTYAMSQSLPVKQAVTAVRATLQALLAALALLGVLALTGCRPPYEDRHEALPDPIGTAHLVAAAIEEPTPLTLAEWQLVDSLLDGYLRTFDDLRASTIAPYVRSVREDRSGRWLADDGALSKFDRRALSIAALVDSLDYTYFADLAQALPARTAFVERARTRRAIDRAARVAIGTDERGVGGSFADLDVEILAVLARPSIADRAAQLRTLLEPLRAAYRVELASAASKLSEALLEFPSDRLKELRNAGLSPDAIDRYVRSGNTGSAEERDLIMGAVRRSQQRIVRAQIAIDDLNVRTAATWASLLPADAADVFQSEATYRRTQPEQGQAMIRWFLEVIEVMPEVRDGRQPRIAAAIRSTRAAIDEYGAATLDAWRDQVMQPGRAGNPQGDERVQKARVAVEEARKSATATVEELMAPDTLAELRSVAGMAAPDARATLDKLIGRGQSARLMTRAPRNMFLRPEPEEESFDSNRSFALQLLLGPLANREDFDRIAAALGAAHDDPIVEELWRRYEERAQALNTQQEEALRTHEKLAQEKGERAENDPSAFEREVADYIRALMAADAARGQLMLDTLEDLAAGRGVPANDPRLFIARAQLTVARCAVPWRRFQLPWLVGPLMLAQTDALALAAAMTPEDATTKAAALAVAMAHAQNLEDTALAARMAGFEALQDFVSLVLRMNRERNSGMSPDEIPTMPEAQAMTRKTRTAALARLNAQLEFLRAMESVLGPQRSARLYASYANASFPEFFAEHTWLASARDMANAAAGGRAGLNATTDALQESASRWRDTNAAVVQRLLQWELLPTSETPPPRSTNLAPAAAADAEFAALRTMRDESALRLLRDAAVLAGEPPNARMPGAIRLVSRPPVAIQP
jgi:hypothetical protein